MNKLTFFTLIVLCSLFMSCNKSEPEIHLLENGFRGRVIIFFDQPNGEPKKYEDGARIYEVPENGILRTQFSFNDGFSKHSELEFFYIDDEGIRTPIHISWADEENGKTVVHPSMVQVFGVSVGRSNDTLVYKQFIVDSYSKASEYEELYYLSQYLNSKTPLPKKNDP